MCVCKAVVFFFIIIVFVATFLGVLSSFLENAGRRPTSSYSFFLIIRLTQRNTSDTHRIHSINCSTETQKKSRAVFAIETPTRLQHFALHSAIVFIYQKLVKNCYIKTNRLHTNNYKYESTYYTITFSLKSFEENSNLNMVIMKIKVAVFNSKIVSASSNYVLVAVTAHLCTYYICLINVTASLTTVNCLIERFIK